MLFFGFTNELEAEAILGLVALKRSNKRHMENEKGYKYRNKCQSKTLEAIFSITRYPSTKTRQNIAILLDMTCRSVQIWFQNARQAIKENSWEVNKDNKQFINFVLKKIDPNDSSVTKSSSHGKYITYDISASKIVEIYYEAGF